jgi:hypothetical protein
MSLHGRRLPGSGRSRPLGSADRLQVPFELPVESAPTGVFRIQPHERLHSLMRRDETGAGGFFLTGLQQGVRKTSLRGRKEECHVPVVWIGLMERLHDEMLF